MIGCPLAERLPETSSALLAWTLPSWDAARSRFAVCDRLPGSSSTFPAVLSGGGCSCTCPGTLAGAAGSLPSRRSLNTARPRRAPRRRRSDERNSERTASSPPPSPTLRLEELGQLGVRDVVE